MLAVAVEVGVVAVVRQELEPRELEAVVAKRSREREDLVDARVGHVATRVLDAHTLAHGQRLVVKRKRFRESAGQQKNGARVAGVGHDDVAIGEYHRDNRGGAAVSGERLGELCVHVEEAVLDGAEKQAQRPRRVVGLVQGAEHRRHELGAENVGDFLAAVAVEHAKHGQVFVLRHAYVVGVFHGHAVALHGPDAVGHGVVAFEVDGFFLHRVREQLAHGE